MSQSIEQIWKQGFTQDDALLPPKIIDLYNAKSKSVAEELMGLFSTNQTMLLVMAAAALLLMSAMGAYPLGLFLSGLFIAIYFYAKKGLASFEALDYGNSSYEYLTKIKRNLDFHIDKFVGIYRIVYPMIFVAMVGQGMYSDTGQKLMAMLNERTPEIAQAFGISFIVWVPVVLITVLIFLFTKSLYRLDLAIMYGRVFTKLDDLIADFEVLNGDTK